MDFVKFTLKLFIVLEQSITSSYLYREIRTSSKKKTKKKKKKHRTSLMYKDVSKKRYNLEGSGGPRKIVRGRRS
jgi:hypothetical protein